MMTEAHPCPIPKAVRGHRPNWAGLPPLALLVGWTHAAPVRAEEQPTPTPAGLARSKTTFAVTAGEFTLHAYDSERGLISVSLPTEPIQAQAGGPRVRLRSDAAMLVPVPPGLLSEVVEAERNGRVELDVEVEPLPASPAVEPNRPADAVDVRPTWVRLNIERNTVVEGPVGGTPPTRGTAAVEVGSPFVEGRVLNDGDEDRMRTSAAEVARKCAISAGAHVPSIRGALQIQLERGPVGDRKMPRVAVDVTLCNRLVDCLTDALYQDNQLWMPLEPGERAFLPIYFKGSPDGGAEPSSGASEPAVSGSVAP